MDFNDLDGPQKKTLREAIVSAFNPKTCCYSCPKYIKRAWHAPTFLGTTLLVKLKHRTVHIATTHFFQASRALLRNAMTVRAAHFALYWKLSCPSASKSTSRRIKPS